ncbi:MAG: hypothetical protein MHM6MM_000435 [Cercozoa sp. M6MM]
MPRGLDRRQQALEMRRRAEPRRQRLEQKREMSVDERLQSAISHLGQSKPELALLAARKAQAALNDNDPRKLQATRLEADALLDMGRFGEAVPVFQRVVKYNRDDSEAWCYLAQASQGDEAVRCYGNAADALGRVLNNAPQADRQRLQFEQARMLASQAECYCVPPLCDQDDAPQRARSLLQEAANISPGNYEVLLQLASLCSLLAHVADSANDEAQRDNLISEGLAALNQAVQAIVALDQQNEEVEHSVLVRAAQECINYGAHEHAAALASRVASADAQDLDALGVLVTAELLRDNVVGAREAFLMLDEQFPPEEKHKLDTLRQNVETAISNAGGEEAVERMALQQDAGMHDDED